MQEYLVVNYAKAENQRLTWIRNDKNQKEILRSENYVNLRAQLQEGEREAAHVGKQVILPCTHVGSPRYMSENASVLF